jgi:hypothetical protein
MEYLRRFAAWFVSGLGLGAGVALVVWSTTKLQNRDREADDKKYLPNTSVVISQVEPIGITEQVAVAAVLENKASTDVGANLELVLIKDAKVIYTCERNAPNTPGPGKSQRIQVECQGVQRSNVPASTTYELRVKRVWPIP